MYDLKIYYREEIPPQSHISILNIFKYFLILGTRFEHHVPLIYYTIKRGKKERSPKILAAFAFINKKKNKSINYFRMIYKFASECHKPQKGTITIIRSFKAFLVLRALFEM